MSSDCALVECTARTPFEEIARARIRVEGGRVSFLGPEDGRPLPRGAVRRALGGRIVCPGFIDLQVNGLGPDAVNSGSPEALLRIAHGLSLRGTTSFLPTATTDSPERLLAIASAVRRAWAAQKEEALPSARILGLHLEGPFLAPAMRGAHPAAHLRRVDLGEVERLAEAAGGMGAEGRPGLRLLTLSPELEGAAEAARRLTGRSVVVAMGHTAASPEDVGCFLEAGGRFAVHAFNRYGAPRGGSPPARPGHRNPGPMAAVASDPRLMAGVVADGVHVHPEVLAAFVRARGWERVVLTSDLVSDGGLAGGAPPAGGRDSRAVFHGGVLSGSRLSLGEMVPLFRRGCGLGPAQAIAAATWNPAGLLGLRKEVGRLAAGAAADLCVLDPGTLEVRAAAVGGRWVVEPESIAKQ